MKINTNKQVFGVTLKIKEIKCEHIRKVKKKFIKTNPQITAFVIG